MTPREPDRRAQEQARTLPPGAPPAPPPVASTQGDRSLAPEATAAPAAGARPSERLRASSAGPLALGSRLGPYEVLKLLGQGGMGAVYVARHTELDRSVALKVTLGRRPSAGQADRFAVEARAAARLRHPNLVSIHDAGVHAGLHYMTMDLIEGEPLDARLKREGRLDPLLAARMTRDLARGLQHAHEQGVVHRDVKPSNVLLARDGRPMLTDFGLAKDLQAQDGLTRTGEVMGTPAYMPPEQVDHARRAGPAADVYSLGATLYAMLAGAPPFEAPSVVALIAQVLRQPPEPPSRRQPSVPAALDAVCLRCLAKDPPSRYSDMKALAEELERYLADAARPPAAGGPRRALAVAGALLLVGAAVAAFVAGRGGPAEAVAHVASRAAGPAPLAPPPGAAATAPAAIAPLPPLPAWSWGEPELLSVRPEFRTGLERAMAYDPSERRVLLFGGSVKSSRPEPVRDLWAFDGAEWTHLGDAGVDPLRAGCAVAFDERRRQLVVHGGETAELAPLSDTWVWDGRWRCAEQGGGPGPRRHHALAWDRAAERLLLHGGHDARGPVADLWAWDGARWSAVPSENAPSPMSYAALVHDHRRGCLVRYGGSNGSDDGRHTSDELWEHDGRRWRLRTPEGERPPPLKRVPMVFDGHRSLLVEGPRVWAWDGTSWAKVTLDPAPEPREAFGLAWDERRRAAVLFGGHMARTRVNDVWLLSAR